jgi:hypothetical protein
MPTVLAIAAGPLGCSGAGGSADILDDSAFVDVMSHLASLRWRFRAARDSLAADSARAAILRERGLDLDDLQRFAEEHFRDTERMAGLWQVIAERADELASGLDEDRDGVLEAEQPDSVDVGRG